MTDLSTALSALVPAQIILIIALVWFLAKMDSRVNETRNMAVRLHKRTDDNEKRIDKLEANERSNM